MSDSVIDFRRSPVDDVSAAAVQNAAQVIERPADVDVRHVNVPVLMSGQRLLETRALLRRLAVPLRQQSRLAENPPDAGRAHCHDVSVQHHERQPPVAFQRASPGKHFRKMVAFNRHGKGQSAGRLNKHLHLVVQRPPFKLAVAWAGSMAAPRHSSPSKRPNEDLKLSDWKAGSNMSAGRIPIACSGENRKMEITEPINLSSPASEQGRTVPSHRRILTL
jgi:hypothetical protein